MQYLHEELCWPMDVNGCPSSGWCVGSVGLLVGVCGVADCELKGLSGAKFLDSGGLFLTLTF